ncbi:MAG: glycerol-3-phosphate dehydrogenase/oxidase [Acidobacteria bacterium]|nr:glycerol-3-phosphate dehydrogenase/oxidase [Acidobacteriota bacterium]
MQRDLAALTAREFDLLVVGGGVYGAFAFWDATLRGLSAALIDRGDIGSGTSFNSAKTIHSGVRVLQSGNLVLLRRFARERRALMRIAPHLVRPLPFVLPAGGGITGHRLLLRAYFALSDRLTRGMNDGGPEDPASRLPPSRLLSRDECLRLNPLIDPGRVAGGIEWFDGQMRNGDRLHFSAVTSAVERGAVAANYVEADGALRRGEDVAGVHVIDRLTGDRFEIRARVVLNAAGPWAPGLNGRLADGASGALHPRLSKAMNLVIGSPLRGTHAVAGSARGRLFFVAPWREVAIVGTSHDRHAGGPGALALERTEIDRFIDDVREAFPALPLRIDDVRLVHRGLLPAAPGGDGLQLATASAVIDHRRDAIHGLVSLLGVRYTTARETAERAVDAVVDQVGRTVEPCRTATTPLAGGDIPDVDAFVRDAAAEGEGAEPAELRRRLARTYGTRYEALAAELSASPEARAPLSPTCAVTVGEVRHAVREEMALRLSDVLLRRTEAGSAGDPGDEAVAAAARVMAGELAWTPAQVEREVTDLRRVYQLPD